jgi:hypothetical protein
MNLIPPQNLQHDDKLPNDPTFVEELVLFDGKARSLSGSAIEMHSQQADSVVRANPLALIPDFQADQVSGHSLKEAEYMGAADSEKWNFCLRIQRSHQNKGLRLHGQ